MAKKLKVEKKPERKFRAWYTHELLELNLSEIQEKAKELEIELADPTIPLPTSWHRSTSQLSRKWTTRGKSPPTATAKSKKSSEYRRVL